MMKTSGELRAQLLSLDRKSYPAYKSLAGAWQFPQYCLAIDHVQGDPFASPSSIHVEIPLDRAGFPESYLEKDCSRIALQDYLTRQLGKQFNQYNFKAKGSGKSGLLSVSRCGQEVLERSACEIGRKLTARFQIGFPAFGRTINAGELEKILFDFLPRCIEKSLFYRNINQKEAEQAVFLAEDQEEIRRLLRKNGWTAFVANGAVLPRATGVSDLPMAGSVPFTSPASLKQTIVLPHRGPVAGMAIRQGGTLIVGGGYHGKSTLLKAIQSGVYNHVAGDGREYVITDETAVKLRAEDGRSVRRVDISLFINDLPNKKDTRVFSTQDASGSTSQAAGLVESMEASSRLFLIDEDTSATNFMVRDDLMQRVIGREKEPITPFIERARDFYEKTGISTIMVAGSSGAFFYIADTILQMDCYRAIDITERVKALCEAHPMSASWPREFEVPDFSRTLPAFSGKNAGDGRRAQRGVRDGEKGGREAYGVREHMKVKSFGVESFSLDKENVDVRYLEQLADSEQTAALAYLLRFAIEQVLDGKKSVRQTVKILTGRLDKEGWEPFCPGYVPCGLARPREQEIFAALNRFRG